MNEHLELATAMLAGGAQYGRGFDTAGGRRGRTRCPTDQRTHSVHEIGAVGFGDAELERKGDA